MNEAGIRYIEDFELAIRELVKEYLRALSPNASQDIHTVRLEASGAGVTVIYDDRGPSERPNLQVSLVGLGMEPKK